MTRIWNGRLARTALLLAVAAGGCMRRSDDDSAEAAPAAAPDEFTTLPLAIEDIKFVTALGNLSPPGHTVPSDHIYFYFAVPDTPYALRAPAAGTVDFVSRPPSQGVGKITIRVSPSLSYYLIHLQPATDIQVGVRVEAGHVLGTADGSLAFDLGAFNPLVARPGFASPGRYLPESLNVVAPLTLFAEPMRTALYGKVLREGPDKDGRIDSDVAGRLVGNWFLEGLAPPDTFAPESWQKHLAFAGSVWRPSRTHISIGGTLGTVGVFSVQSAAPDPKDVSPATGKLAYRLYGADGVELSTSTIVPSDDSQQLGLFIVRMPDDARIQVELFMPSTATDADFTSNAKIYIR